MHRRRALALLAAGIAAPRAAASGTPDDAAKPLSFSEPCMGTRFTIQCHHPDAAAAANAAAAAFAVAREIDAVASDYKADSELSKLANSPPATQLPVSPLLHRLIAEALAMAALTEGLFDPTLGPLTQLWRESRRRKQLPDKETLDAARAASGWRHLTLGPDWIAFARPHMRLDLGGIAKGQAADAMLAMMQQHQIPCACITAGGDVRAGSPPPAQQGWIVALVPPTDPPSSPVTLANAAISTSGDLHQSVTINGVSYSHIIDPTTGLGTTNHSATTILAPTATQSDALATAASLTTPPNATRLAQRAHATLVRITPP